MGIHRIRIISNNIYYVPCPLPDTEVEQHLTITSAGRVYFSSYLYGDGFEAFRKSKVKNFSIPKETALKILDAVEKYFTEEYVVEFATDIGSWDMEVINENNEKATYRGSLCSRLVIENTDLSALIREALEMPNLLVFDGDDDSERNDGYWLCPLSNEEIYTGTCMEVSDHFDKQSSTTDLPTWIDDSKEEEQKKVCQNCKYHCF